MNYNISTDNLLKIKEAYEIQDFLVGTVSYIGRAYLIVKIFDYPCIMYKSETEIFHVKDFSIYLNKEIVVRVVSIQQNETTGLQIFVSHKSVAEETLAHNRIMSFSDIKKNQIYKGIIKDYKEFGVFITLGCVDGLVHKNHLPTEFASTPENFVTRGSVVDVVVIYKDYQKKQLSLSIPSIDPNLDSQQNKHKTPFEQFRNSLIPNESIVQGKVVFLEKDCVTLHVTHHNNVFSVYIKKEDLAWESIQNTSDVVFLGEELSIKYLNCERGKLFFDLKWQQQDLYPEDLFLQNTEELLSIIGIYGNKFIAQVSLLQRNNTDEVNNEISGALATNLLAVDDDDKNSLMVDPYTGNNIVAFVPSRYAFGLENGKYYQFKLLVASQKKRLMEHRPFMFSAQLENAIPVSNPYRELVEKSFKENKTPKSNRESAGYLKEIGADMYTERDRMFYELLQNADDASPKRGVKVMVQIKDNFLIFTHDGLSFSRQDFRSIVSTAYSTKRLDRKKTGYKGIGFKSVFTDSEKVYIKTGGFFFVFDKNASLFNDFRTFYRYVNPLYTEEQLKVFFDENHEYEKEFERVDHIPWQLLPFWVDECPEQLKGTTFSRNCNVAIALDLGVKAEKYKETIRGIIQKPRFMLFLRNTQRIQFEDKKWDILSIAKHKDDNTNVVTLKNSFAKNENEVSYIVRDGNEIPVNNEAFEKCNIPMFKESKDVAGREKWFMYQIIDKLPVPITSIPERIIAADTTTISYAFMLDENGHSICIPDKTPSLYAYLPMEDRRYLFPFFINADFELSSNRQEAKRVSVWNEFLFYNIGKSIVSWVASIAKPSHPDYLALLPSSFFVEELEENKIDRLASQFNRGYKEALTETPFICNDREEIASQNEILIDESGFADVIGAEDFCKLMGTQKRMLHKDLNAAPLCNKEIFTEVEHLQTNEVVEKILNNECRTQILKYWLSISSSRRTSVLSHIANMPGNKKNLYDHLLDIPAYTCNSRVLSFNKLLKSNNVIIRSEVIIGIEDIIGKLGFLLTDEDEEKHPFHSRIEEAMNGYAIHVFEIIKTRTIEKSQCLTADEKFKLFSHFSSSKRGIEHDWLRNWALFCNQLGEVVPLAQLTHINSTLYNNITKQFVIEETEYKIGSRTIDRYLMNEKDQYREIVINKWNLLVSEIGDDEEKACSLYKLATTTFTVAEHEQGEEQTQIHPNTDGKFVYANEQMHLLSEVVLNETVSANDEARALVEKLTGKHIPSLRVTKAIQLAPFDCKNQSLESVTLLPNVALSQDDIEVLLQFCASNNESFFIQYGIVKTEDTFVFNKLANGSVNAYTSSPALKTFINNNCQSIKLLPDELSKYSELKGVFTEDDLLLKILDTITDINKHAEILLPIYQNSISSVKLSYISHLSNIEFNETSCTDENEISIQTLLLASSIEKPENEFFDNLRKIVYITCGTTRSPLSSIKLEHTVEVNGKKYPLSKLQPNEDNMALLVDTLRERIEDYVPSSFTDKLFGIEVDKSRASSIFSVLNKSNKVLDNGAQIAFILDYAIKFNQRIVCKVNTSETVPSSRELDETWLLQKYSFIRQEYILNDKYSDVTKYMSIPFSNNRFKCKIQNELVGFDYIKASLNNNEVSDLLDLIFKKSSSNTLIATEDLKRIMNSLSIANQSYIVSSTYSLPDEHLPENIESWRTSSDQENRTAVLCNLFGIINDDSDVVRIRAFLKENTPLVITQEDVRTSSLTCKWISQCSIIVDDNQYLHLQDILDEKDYFCELDDDTLSKHISPEFHYMDFNDYNLYLYNGGIPWNAKLKSNNYIFHRYCEGDIALCERNIFVNEKQIDNIIDLIRSLVNSDGFTTEDFLSFFDQYQAKISGSLDGEIDDDLDPDARSAANDLAKQEAINWLSAKGYDVSQVQTEFSFLNGVKKDGVEYHIVVKSYRPKKKELKINPNEWLYLLNANSRLMLYMKHMTFAVIDRDMLLGNHDFLRLRISASNFKVEGNRLNETISRLAKDIQYFERTHFVFEHVHDCILSRANSLEDYGLFKSNSNEQFTPANEDLIL